MAANVGVNLLDHQLGDRLAMEDPIADVQARPVAVDFKDAMVRWKLRLVEWIS